MDTSNATQAVRTYHRLKTARFNYLAEGARMQVYISPQFPRVVLKIMASARHLADKFAGWGIPLDQMAWAPVKGDALASAQRMLNDSQESFALAQRHLNGLAAPFLFLDGTAPDIPEGSFKLIGPDGREIERNFKGAIAVVQERIRTFEEFIPSAMGKGKESDCFAVFRGFIDLTLNLWKRGLFFEVLNFHNDYGIDETGRVLITDLGELIDSKARTLDYVRGRKMFDEHAYRAWLSIKYPRLADFYRTIVDSELTADRLQEIWGVDENLPENQVAFNDQLLNMKL